MLSERQEKNTEGVIVMALCPLPTLSPSDSKSSCLLTVWASFRRTCHVGSLIAYVESELDAAMLMHPLESIHSAMCHAVLPDTGKVGSAKCTPPCSVSLPASSSACCARDAPRSVTHV
jgi:hypothetical protein